MKLELGQLCLRYEHLRIRNPARQGRLLASVLAHGQQVPVVVVADEESPESYVLIDGYVRVAVLEKLCRDEVLAQLWQMSEARALVLSHRLDSARARTALEQGWLLATLERDHEMHLGELAILLGRSRSWVSRRLGLVKVLPAPVQEAVRQDQVSAQAAQRYLVPLARANAEQCEKLVSQLGSDRISVRQMRTLYVGWRGGDATVRQRIVESPLLYLAAHEVAADGDEDRDDLARDLDIVASVARRARRRMDQGALAGASAARRRRIARRLSDAERAVRELRTSLEASDAGLGNTDGDLAAGQGGTRAASDRQSGGGVAQRGAAGGS